MLAKASENREAGRRHTRGACRLMMIRCVYIRITILGSHLLSLTFSEVYLLGLLVNHHSQRSTYFLKLCLSALQVYHGKCRSLYNDSKAEKASPPETKQKGFLFPLFRRLAWVTFKTLQFNVELQALERCSVLSSSCIMFLFGAPARPGLEGPDFLLFWFLDSFGLLPTAVYPMTAYC